MGKIKPGNKQNAAINGEHAKHVRAYGKKLTSGLRRALVKKDTQAHVKENERDWDDEKEWFKDNQYCDCEHCLNRIELEKEKKHGKTGFKI